MVELSAALHTAREIGSEISEKNVTFMAAGIAYNAFLSLAPILVLLLVVVSAVGGGLEERIVELAEGSLPGPIADVVVQVFQGGAGDPAASAIGLVVLVWGTLKIFRGLDTAFSEIYETAGANSFVSKVVDGLIVLVALVAALLATVGVTIVFAAFSDVVPFIGALTPVVLVAGLVVAFLPMYYRFPDTELEWRDVLPGAVFAAVGWAAFQAVFQVYLAVAGSGSDSLFGGVIMVVTWLYFSGLVLLIGAVINAVHGRETTGTAAGTGLGSAGYDTRREEELSPAEFNRYLNELRRSLREDGRANGRYPSPADGVLVIEEIRGYGNDRELSLAFRWRSRGDERG